MNIESKSLKLSKFLNQNKVTILFIIMCVGGIIASKQPMTFIVAELFTRIGRNAFLVLALIIPVLAGMGLNFGIVIGAIAAQIAVFVISYFEIPGIQGFIIAAVITTPIAALFGYLVGVLFNKMKGSEMIGGMILGFFADGLYQFLFLFIIGGVIPVNNARLIMSNGVGVKNTIDLKDSIKYALDKQPLLPIVEFVIYATLIICACLIIYNLFIKKSGKSVKKYIVCALIAAGVYAATYVPMVFKLLTSSNMHLMDAFEFSIVLIVIVALVRLVYEVFFQKDKSQLKRRIFTLVFCAVAFGISFIPKVESVLLAVQIPALTYALIVMLCGFNMLIIKTRLGQNMRTVGQSMVVANAAGINVDKTRIIAMMISTILAGYGQLILLQNIGTFQTYGAHTQVGQFAIAALLVGGASVHMASNKQAILGVILFHTLFIIAPLAGKELFGNAQIGEYFRVFVAFGIIALALAMHAWKKVVKAKGLKDQQTNK